MGETLWALSWFVKMVIEISYKGENWGERLDNKIVEYVDLLVFLVLYPNV